MERLERKKIKGNFYYYYSHWGWVDGKCRRLRQKYLGKLEDIVAAVDGKNQPVSAEIFQAGFINALWSEIQRFGIIEIIDKHCPKRKQGLTVGEYIAIAAINRTLHGVSKNAMWEWFSQTTLMRHIPKAKESTLKSQRFWDHISYITEEKAQDIWNEVTQKVIQKEEISLDSISYDGTNFYSFISTFNTQNTIAKRGKNKQGRNNLRQISYGLFCTRDGQIPIYYDVYNGSKNDAKQFPEILQRFKKFLLTLPGKNDKLADDTTVIFDKGNNSKANIELLDELKLNFVGSVKLGEHKELAEISNNDSRFEPCLLDNLRQIKSFSVKKTVYGKTRRIIVSFNQELFNTQFQTVNNDITKTSIKLSELAQRLIDRVNGVIKGGKKPTVLSVQKNCNEALKRPYMKDLFKYEILDKKEGVTINFQFDYDAQKNLLDTYLGKKLLLTSRDWQDEIIIDSYHSQYVIEHVFRGMKDRDIGTWWPLNHWTDQKIDVHGLYNTLAVLIRNSIHRRLKKMGINLSMQRMIKELSDIKEVVNIYETKKKRNQSRVVLSKTNEIQDNLIKALDLKFLG